MERNGASEVRASPPAATGSAGPLFEQHVLAYWLAQLLVRGRAPIIRDSSVVEVRSQTKHLGWHTDDFLITAEDPAGGERKLAGQVKRSFTISALNEECERTIGGFWRDYRASGRFCRDTDRLVLVTQLGTTRLLRHFGGLLACADAAPDCEEFERRLETPGFISGTAGSHCDEVCKIVGEIEGTPFGRGEVWSFLKSIKVLSLDLATATKQTEANVKTLLEHSCSLGAGSADASWNELLAVAGQGMAGAGVFRRDSLPEELVHLHSALGGEGERALKALAGHSEPILEEIRSTIGREVKLPRAGLVQELLARLESDRVVLVSGAAGTGKSAVAKAAVEVLAEERFAFAFRAEEFASAHLDRVLSEAQVPISAAALRAVLGAQERIVFLLESVERLLERGTREAFGDLLRIAVADGRVQLVLTCRAYAAEIVRTSFLVPVGATYSVLEVPELSEAELEEVEGALPALARPLGEPRLRGLLSNPYYLDRAAQLSWAVDQPLPRNERELRSVFWKQVVRAEDRRAHGMPLRRERAFSEIAVRRAQALAQYVDCDDLDPAVVDSLRQDSLVSSADWDEQHLAPAHDVLEDWAILQWIEQQHHRSGGSFGELAGAIGGHPALRRSYREWVTELVATDVDSADRLFNEAVTVNTAPEYLRDDTLVSLLRSALAPHLLERNVGALLADERALLKRVIHVLRVGCVALPREWSELRVHVSPFYRPEGPAWASVLRLVHAHVEELIKAGEALLVLGLIRDWSSVVSWQRPCPEGAESVAAIAHSLLPAFEDYRRRDSLREALEVIVKIPGADRQKFVALLRGPCDVGDRDRTRDEVRDMVLVGFQGSLAAREAPREIVASALSYILCFESDVQPSPFGRSDSLDNAELFGVRRTLDLKYSPRSALQGPWLTLLRVHPDVGIAFFLAVFNHSADWYANPRISRRSVERPDEVALTLSDGTVHKQWANARLWQWYRGISVGPMVLQCLLMALEKWLLEIAESRPRDLDAELLRLLRGSESAAISAVVASVATAFPDVASEALLTLLRSRTYMQLDRERLARELQAPSRLARFLPSLRPHAEFHRNERKTSDELPHRGLDLEAAVIHLQFGSLAARVQEILDEHRASLPAASERGEIDRLWLLALNRMDLRRLSVVPEGDALSRELEPDGTFSVQLDVAFGEGEQDVEAMIEESRSLSSVLVGSTSLLMWGLSVFRREKPEEYDPDLWQERLGQAMAAEMSQDEEPIGRIARAAPAFVAAVCVRDRWADLSATERCWCVTVVCSEVERHANQWDEYSRIQRNDMSADRPAASVLPLLLGRPLSETTRERVERAFSKALTHPVDEVRLFLTRAASNSLWSIDSALAMRCVNALATEATMIDRAREARRREGRRGPLDADVLAQAAAAVQERFWSPGAIAENAYEGVDGAKWFGTETNIPILLTLVGGSATPMAVAAFRRVALMLVRWWDEGYEEPLSRPDIDTEMGVRDLLVCFLLRSSRSVAEEVLQPVLGAVHRHPQDVDYLIRELVRTEDREPHTGQFWFIWRLFARKVKCAERLLNFDDERAPVGGLVSTIFLGTGWKKGVRHWRSLEDNDRHVHALFQQLSPSARVLESYIRFLYHVGERSLPRALVLVVECLRRGKAHELLGRSNTVFMLEVILQRYVYSRPVALKGDPALRDAVLVLLDLLVEQGSSAAFGMRDDFVTPLAVT